MSKKIEYEQRALQSRWGIHGEAYVLACSSNPQVMLIEPLKTESRGFLPAIKKESTPQPKKVTFNEQKETPQLEPIHLGKKVQSESILNSEKMNALKREWRPVKMLPDPSDDFFIHSNLAEFENNNLQVLINETEKNAEEYAARTKELLGIQHRMVKFIEIKKKMEAEKAKSERSKMTNLFQSMEALNSYMRKSYDADKGMILLFFFCTLMSQPLT